MRADGQARAAFAGQPTEPGEVGILKPVAHPFQAAPHQTLVTLSIPVLFSLAAEPLTGLVDTAFIARLGASPLAALGVGTTVLSGIFWIFNFLGVGSQTEVAHRLGRQDRGQAAAIATLAVLLGALFGLLLIGIGWALVPWIAGAMGARETVCDQAVQYMRIRLWGAPAVIVSLAAIALVPRSAHPAFFPAWLAAILMQPANALAFASDGLHWGSGDFRYLRNVMMGVSLAGAFFILRLDMTQPGALVWIWGITGGWVTGRAAFGVLRIWPGVGQSPFAPGDKLWHK